MAAKPEPPWSVAERVTTWAWFVQPASSVGASPLGVVTGGIRSILAYQVWGVAELPASAATYSHAIPAMQEEAAALIAELVFADA
jgi:lipase chaperone LimK